ncbi:IS66 family insertion sequence element accessory protein TnpB [Salipiger sp. 1_MG-2023]|uniref:IS66 family insertion sequence element accessory protein TnpB n=1 Tax=Salipiger sp. 1_MG-2023 TaxID=3062665 RepID=UPI0034C68CF5
MHWHRGHDPRVEPGADHGCDRKGDEGSAALVKNELPKEPFTGTVFVFRAERADRLKRLNWVVPREVV